MHQLASKVKVSPKVFTLIAVGVLSLSGLGYRLYGQHQTLQDFSKQIQSLPASVPPEEKLKLEKERIALESTLTGTLAQIFTGGFFFITAYFTWGNLQVANAKQITERFTQAINQFGSEKIEVRLGGIYALQRISKDSPKDHWTIMEYLTAFVRERSPVVNLQSEDNTQPKIPTDVQAALTVIGRRDLKKEETDQRINLRQTDLSGADLRNANLIDANLSGANLSRADLIGANLSRANLSGANLSRANLSGADLSRANLIGANLIDANLSANLSNANLGGANLGGANLSRANLGGAYLGGAYLSCADLNSADLNSANLRHADLSRADLCGAKLWGANLRDANLSSADLRHAKLWGADLRNADLHGANLIDANLIGIKLNGVNLIGANLNGAILIGAKLIGVQNRTEKQLAVARLCKTTLPEGCNLNPNRDCEALGISLDLPAIDSPE